MKNRCAHCIVYPESCPDIEDALNKLEPKRYAYILHDCDADENGELKKPHYHVYLYFENAREFKSIANVFGIAENNIELVKNKRALIRYFTHIDDPEKYQYSYKDIVSFNFNVEANFSEVSEADQLSELLDTAEDCINQGKISTFEIMRACAEKGLCGVLRRYQTLVGQMIREARKGS